MTAPGKAWTCTTVVPHDGCMSTGDDLSTLTVARGQGLAAACLARTIRLGFGVRRTFASMQRDAVEPTATG